MKKRCLNKNNKNFPNYGGRGISVCEEWMEFISFRDWSLSNGYAEGLAIDRIMVNGDYEPTNCRFVTATVNNRNKRTTKLSTEKVSAIRALLEAGDMTQKQIGEKYGVPQTAISQIKSNKLWATI
jgi:hypothetical protein